MFAVSVMTRQRGARAEKLNTEEQKADGGDPLEALGNMTTLTDISNLTETLYCSLLHTWNSWPGLSYFLPAARDQLFL